MPPLTKTLTTDLPGRAALLDASQESLAEPLPPHLNKDPGLPCSCGPYPTVRLRDMGAVPQADQAVGAISSTLPAFHHGDQVAGVRHQ